MPLLKSDLNIYYHFLQRDYFIHAFIAAVIIRVAYVEKLSLTFLAASCGLLVCVEVIVFGAITGAAMNPIRAIGPHFAANFPGELWIYIFGPTLGFLFVAEIYIYLKRIVKSVR